MSSPSGRPTSALSRRTALGRLARLSLAALVAPGLLPRAARALVGPGPVTHPEPRPGVTGARVLAESAVPAKYRDAYQAAREIPQVLDGLYCHCDCLAHRGLRSLLTCYETDMPQSCGICLGEARLARRLHAKGEGLPEIRVAIDKQYGGRSGPRDAARADTAHHHVHPDSVARDTTRVPPAPPRR